MKDDKFTLYVQDGIFCHFLASMFSGLVTTIASMPVDIAKTRYMINILVIKNKLKNDIYYFIDSDICMQASLYLRNPISSLRCKNPNFFHCGMIWLFGP